MQELRTSQNYKVIKASKETLYDAFTNPDALALWQAPGEMTAKVYNFDLKVGGGYEMSLFYPSTDQVSKGKTSEKEDKYTARFVELDPFNRMVLAIKFDTVHSIFEEEMIMEATFEIVDVGTRVKILFKNIPPGISIEDNEKGTELSLEKLARYVEKV